METPKVTAHTIMLRELLQFANRRNGTPGALRFATLAAANSSTTPCGANDEGTQAQTVREKLAPYPGNSFCIENCGPLF